MVPGGYGVVLCLLQLQGVGRASSSRPLYRFDAAELLARGDLGNDEVVYIEAVTLLQ